MKVENTWGCVLKTARYGQRFCFLFAWDGAHVLCSRLSGDLCIVKICINHTAILCLSTGTLNRKLIIKVKYIWPKCALGKVITRDVNNVTGIKLINSCGRRTCHCNHYYCASYTSVTSLMLLQDSNLVLLCYKFTKLDFCGHNFCGLVVFPLKHMHTHTWLLLLWNLLISSCSLFE